MNSSFFIQNKQCISPKQQLFKMRNNFLFQNDQKPLNHQLSTAKIILKSNGKISLSKSTKSHSQRDQKNLQINSLKKQIFKLKCQLEEEKIENKKITILSNEIRKVKEKLIQKVNQKNARDSEQNCFENPHKKKPQNPLAEYMNQKQTVKETTLNQQIQNPKVSFLKDSTDQIFKNFSLVKSISKKSQKLQQTWNLGKKIQANSKIMYLDEIESLESRQIIQSRLNQKLLKIKNSKQSVLQDKTVKYPNLRDKPKNIPKYSKEFQEYEVGDHIKIWPETQKLSVTNCIKNKKNRQQDKK